MQKSTILIIVALVVVLVGGYFFVTREGDTAAVTGGTADIHDAWIEVTSDSVYLSSEGKKTLLKSGDAVGVGATIETGSTGTAVIHFPDASLARMDVNTTLTLSALSFNTKDNSLIVSIGLSIGRVWSKVIGLATPESSWEVQTSNTVATVRGTAFGVGYKKDGTSWVLGSQHTVAVAPKDPKTKQKIESAEVVLNENNLIQLDDTDAAIASTAIGSSAIAVKITGIVGEFRTNAWIHAAQEADKKFDAKFDALRGEGASDASIREEMRQEDMKLKDEIKQMPKETVPEVTRPVTPKETEKPTVTSPSSALPSPTVETTTIRASRTLNDLTEDDVVQFKAIVGANRDVTSEVSWRVVGSIGSITSSGLFTALLGNDVSEFGQGIGSVTATLPNGGVLQSASIHVQAKIPTGLGTEG